jgi:aspartyl-tRNA(Asn)/glutamyl-tRNA(Gln) amidotransferase subunit B
MAVINGKTGPWEMVIGLEVHAQIKSQSKLFSNAPTHFGAKPNSQVALVDAALPGMLPVINAYCIEQAVKTGLGLEAEINLYSVFDRKNYFYADLPQGYQISQFKQPIVGKGSLKLDMANGEVRVIGITRLHLEQDAGKSLHDHSPRYSFIDLNRSGVALMEIVSEPDLRSAEEAGEYMKKIRTLLRYLGTCDGDMEKGSLRCDANISVRKAGDPFGTRCEIKNLNSIRHIIRAIEYEAERQVELLENGQKIDQETRLFDAQSGVTRTMRSKEDAHDYRYFPDPDLLPLIFTQDFVDAIRVQLPELPDHKKQRYIDLFGLTPYDAHILSSDRDIADYFEIAVENRDAKLVANWISAELFGRLNKMNLTIDQSPVSAASLGALIDLISNQTISGKIAKQVFDIMIETGEHPDKIVKDQGLVQLTDQNAIAAMIDQILANNEDKVAQYRAGKEALFGFFVGQVMKASQGKANPELVNQLLRDRLSASS